MKRRTITLAATLLLAVAPAFAQGYSTVFDPSNWGTALKELWTNIENHADVVTMTGEQIEAIASVYGEAEKITTTMQKVYGYANGLIDNTRIVSNAADIIMDNQRVLTALYNDYYRMFDDGHITQSQLTSSLTDLNYASQALLEDYNVIKAILNSSTTAKEKWDLLNETALSSKMRTEGIARAQAAAKRRALEKEARETRKALDHSIYEGTGTNANGAFPQINWSTQTASLDNITGNENYSMDQAEAHIRNSNKPLIDFTQLVIGFLFLISLAWGAARYFKGDHQHFDIPLKIAGGLFVIIALLTIVKTVLF